MSLPFVVRPADWIADHARLRQVRHDVFVVEQGVPEALEWDGLDADAAHVLAEDADGTPVAVGRLLPDGHIGRLAVQAPWRGRNVGGALLEYLMAEALRRGHRDVVLNAQMHALGFYARHGFAPSGDEFIEAGIPHQEMRRSLV